MPLMQTYFSTTEVPGMAGLLPNFQLQSSRVHFVVCLEISHSLVLRVYTL